MARNSAGRGDFSPVRMAVFAALSLAMMGVIFVFSAQDSELSAATSGWASRIVRYVLSPVLPNSAMDFILKYLRKIAHISVYFMLGIFTALSACEISRKVHRFCPCLILGWLICVLYAISDEFHQSFTPGRFPSPWDVMIDSAGALVSTLTVGGIHLLRGRKRLKAGEKS